MKKIAILSSADPRIKRGLQVVALTHAKSMRKYGLDAVIFCPSEKYEAYELEGVPVYTFAFTKGRYSALNFVRMMVACWRGWTKHFGGKEPDVLHGHDPMTYYFLSQYLSRNVRKIYTVHDPFIYHHRMLGTLPSGMSQNAVGLPVKFLRCALRTSHTRPTRPFAMRWASSSVLS